MMMLGRLGSVWGIKGQIKAFSESGDFEHFRSLSSVSLGAVGGFVCTYEIENVQVQSGQILLKLKGIETPEAARSLTGCFIWVDRSQATPLGKGEFYISDLVGYSVIDTRNKALGIIKGVLYGARQPLLEVIGDSLFVVPLAKPFLVDIKDNDQLIVVERDFVL